MIRDVKEVSDCIELCNSWRLVIPSQSNTLVHLQKAQLQNVDTNLYSKYRMLKVAAENLQIISSYNSGLL